MHKRLIILVILLSTINLYSQNNNKQFFFKQLNNLSININNDNWADVCNFIYPKAFKYISKDNILLLMEQTDIMGVDINSKLKSVNSVSKLLVSGKEKYHKINYSSIICVSLTGLMSYSQDIVKPNLDKEFGSENIKYIDSINTYVIKSKRYIYAISDIKNNNWHYIDIDSGLIKGGRSLIPSNVINQLK